MLLQYKICTFAFSVMHAYVCPNGSPQGGREEGRGEGGEGAGGFSQGYGNKVETVLCLLPSAHTKAKLNSNKIRHRCALLAQTSIVRNMGEGLVTLY